MANREQKNKDKANMKKKQEKKQAANKSSSPASSSAFAELPAALTNLLDNLEQKATASLSHLGSALSALSVTRLSPSLFDSLPVPMPDGSAPSLSSLSSISSRSAGSVVVSLFDPEHLKPVTRALSTHRLPGQVDNVNPQLEQEGDEVRLVVRWTRQGKEAKDEMRRDITKKGEEVKAAIRSHRQAALVGLKRAGGSDEEKEQIRSRLQQLVDESIADVEKAVKDKEKEITES